jgi:Divergent InlB B-repeat domain
VAGCLVAAVVVAGVPSALARPAAGSDQPPTALQLEQDIVTTYEEMVSLENEIKLENAAELIFAPVEFEQELLACLHHASPGLSTHNIVANLEELKALDNHLGGDLRQLKTRFPTAYKSFLQNPAVEVLQQQQATLKKRGRARKNFRCTAPPPCRTPQNIALKFTGYAFSDGTVRYGWATGAVEVTGNDGSAVRRATFGRISTDVAYLGPWKCGATVTLKARPDTGMHFDHWVSAEGLCKGKSLTCKTRLVPNASKGNHDIRAFFAITVYKLSVTNTNMQAGIVQGGPNTIACGDLGNYTPTHCAAHVAAQRSSNDMQEVDADPNGAQSRWSVASMAGCDSVVYVQIASNGQRMAKCYLAMNNDRTITVNWTQVAE